LLFLVLSYNIVQHRARTDLLTPGAMGDEKLVRAIRAHGNANKFMFLAMMMLMPLTLSAAEIRVAVASNFSSAMKALATRFEADSGHRLLLGFGSTGKHYAQILNGAPFDAFFAADTERPRLLEMDNRTVAHSRFTYARGRLILWSPRTNYVDSEGLVLKDRGFRHLAIANPKLAPYGEAARQVLTELGLWEQLSPKLVRGENIGQTYQFVASGNAELGFVAWSQLIGTKMADRGSYWTVPSSLHQPINQQAVQLIPGEPVRLFMSFVQSAAGRQIISQHGYDLPDAD
jgi:molybdate transport system substrate-binding protein